ncbi:hypothetical protein ES702_06758 [subsurface metagenome]
MSPVTKARPILLCLFAFMAKYHKNYCYPSQKTLISRLMKYQGEKLSLASINRWLRAVEEAGYIHRQRRGHIDRVLGNIFESTMYYITYKGKRLLARGGLAVWKIFKAIEGAMKGKRPGPRSGPGPDPYLSGVAPLKDIVGGLLKNPVIGEHVGSSK